MKTEMGSLVEWIRIFGVADSVAKGFPDYESILADWKIYTETRWTNKLGVCHYKPFKQIGIHFELIQNRSNPTVFPVLRNTLLHEIAHALQFERTGKSDHGTEWRYVYAIRVGCDPTATTKIPPGVFVKIGQKRRRPEVICDKCGIVFESPKIIRYNRTYTHRGCGGKVTRV